MKIYAEITMMVAIETQETDEDTIKDKFADCVRYALDNSEIETQETDEDTIKDKFADCVRYALDNSEITDYEYIDVLEVRKAAEQE